jgi:hypothetical protein
MTTLVDSLVVSLGLDSSGFDTGQKKIIADLKSTEEAATRTAKNMQAGGAQAAEFFGAIKTEALSLLGVFLGGKGIEDFVRSTTRSLADLGRQAVNIGETTQDIQAFAQAVARMGGNAQDAQNSLEGLAKARQQWLTFGNNPEFMQSLGIVGASPTMSPLEIMRHFADWIKVTENQPGGPQRIQMIGGMLGVDQGTINSLMQMDRNSTLAEQMQRSAELGDVASKQQIEAATRFQTSVASFEQAVEGLARALIPFEAMSKQLDEITAELTGKAPHPSPAEVYNAPVEKPAEPSWLQRHLPWWLGGTLGTPGGGWAAAPGAGPRANPNDPRGIRNNNPLNLEYAPGQGASTSDGRFGIYPTMEEGVAAAARQIQQYRSRYGLNTISGIVGRWAPAGENNTNAYVASVSKAMGVGPNVPLNLNDPAVMSALIAAMSQVENGRALDPGVVRRGVAGGLSPNGAPRTGPAFGQQTLPDPALAPGRLAAPRVPTQPQTSSNDNSTSVNVGSVTINTPTNDPAAHAAAFNQSLAQQINAQSNRGLQ